MTRGCKLYYLYWYACNIII